MAVCGIPTRKTRRRHAKMQYKACLREVNESEGGERGDGEKKYTCPVHVTHKSNRAVLNMELSWETTISSGSVASNVCDAKIGRATNATQG